MLCCCDHVRKWIITRHIVVTTVKLHLTQIWPHFPEAPLPDLNQSQTEASQNCKIAIHFLSSDFPLTWERCPLFERCLATYDHTPLCSTCNHLTGCDYYFIENIKWYFFLPPGKYLMCQIWHFVRFGTPRSFRVQHRSWIQIHIESENCVQTKLITS